MPRPDGRALSEEGVVSSLDDRGRDSLLVTLAGVLLGLAAVSAFVWWIIALSPVGLGGRFENTTGGGEIRTLVNGIFSLATGVMLTGGLGAASLAWWRHRRRRG